MVFFVVFGHLSRGFSSPVKDDIYRVIYTFHIPVLIFVSGYFARFNRWKIISSLIYPYILFQVLYILFDGLVYNGTNFVIQFTTPNWILWYMMTLIWYYLLIPFIDSDSLFIRVFTVAGVVGGSLLAGKFSDIGYFMSLSRFFTFWPYFVLGYYLGHPADVPAAFVPKTFSKSLSGNTVRIILLCLVCLMAWFVRQNPHFSNNVLFGSNSYADAGYTPGMKLMLLLIAFTWIAFFMVVIPNVKIPLFSSIGTATLPIFLLHGFCVRLLQQYGAFSHGTLGNLLLSVVVDFGILLLFGNPVSNFLFRKLCTGWWLEAIVKKLRTISAEKQSGGTSLHRI